MGKSGPRHKGGIIIHEDRFWIIKIIELFTTCILWLYLAGTLVFVISIIFNMDFEWKRLLMLIFQMQEADVKLIMYKIGILGIVFFMVQFIWGFYNYRRFGKLKRRRFPQKVNPHELADYFSITEEEVSYLQEQHIITLKDRIV